MTFGKISLLAVGFLCAMALGVWIGPYVTDRGGMVNAPAAQVAQQTAAAAQPSGVAHPSAAVVKSRQAAARGVAPPMETPLETKAVISLSAPELHTRMKPLLNEGADLNRAVEGFGDAEQFAAVAHAARNTEIPFALLKHRVLTEGKTLTAAILELKPGVNAAIEANRAQAEAKSDIATLAG
jgi:hypothetical protein